MNDPGKNIANLIAAFRSLCGDIALLIRTADALMEERGWESAANQCTSLGTTPERADAWFPDDVFHFYKRPEPQYAHLLAFVSTIIASRDPKLRLEEPLVSAGLLEYERGAEALKSWQWWYAHAHCLSPNRMDDGTIVVNREKHLLVRWNSKVEAVRTLAVPLVRITSADELRTRVIDVLDEEFRNVSI